MEDFLTFRTNAKVVVVDRATPYEPVTHIDDGLHYPLMNRKWSEYMGLLFNPTFVDFYPVAIHALFLAFVLLVQIHFLFLANITGMHRLITVLMLVPLALLMVLRICFCVLRFQNQDALAFWQIMFDLASAGWISMTALFVFSFYNVSMGWWALLVIPLIPLVVHPSHSMFHALKADVGLAMCLFPLWWDLFSANMSLLVLTLLVDGAILFRSNVTIWRLSHQLILDVLRWSLYLDATLTILHLWLSTAL